MKLIPHPTLQDKVVDVKSVKGGWLHRGVVLGCDPVFTDSVHIGVTASSIPGATNKPNQKYISVFRTSASKLAEVKHS